MKIQLSDHFTCSKLLRFTLPSIVMMVFTSIYGVVDGYFVSNYVGKTPFPAVNFIYPVLMIMGCAGFMFGTGGGALIAKTMGEGAIERANRIFSLIVYASAACGGVLAVLGVLFVRPDAILLSYKLPAQAAHSLRRTVRPMRCRFTCIKHLFLLLPALPK